MIDFKETSQRGNKRKGINQDSILALVQGDSGIFVVSDGMGGLAKGEYASLCVVDEIRQWWDQRVSNLRTRPITVCADELEDVLRRINAELYHQTDVGGATVVLLLVNGDAYAVINAGDSRIYYSDSEETLLQLSSDDIWEHDSDLTQNLTPEEISTSPERGKLTNAVGIMQKFVPSTNTGSLKQKCQFLLVSDGVYKYCSEEKMISAVRNSFESNNLDSAVDTIVSEVYQNGAKDNLSVILVSYR